MKLDLQSTSNLLGSILHRSRVLGALAPLLCAGTARAQAPELVTDGSLQSVPYTSDHEVQDFLIPTGAPPFLRVTVRGGEGGSAKAGDNCKSEGGAAARASAVFPIGFGPAELMPGGHVRFIVGQDGKDDVVGGTSKATGGGGGGSAVLYRPLNGDWVILIAAGGGGGAFQSSILGSCASHHSGRDASVNESGKDGYGQYEHSGGKNGKGGNSGDGGGGGGAFGKGEEIFGGLKGYPNGGSGGQVGSGTGSKGGWGFGGGGVGAGGVGPGGGGGYSGGGAGDFDGGGGGGSFASPILALSSTIVVSNATGDGSGSYYFFDELGAATCDEAPPIHDGIITGSTAEFGSFASLETDCDEPYFGVPAWFSYTNSDLIPKLVTASTCDTPFSTSKTNITILDSCESDAQVVACGVAGSCGASSHESVTWEIGPLETHWIRVTALNLNHPISGAGYQLEVSSTPVLTIVNDTCNTALMLEQGEYSAILAGADADPTDVSCAGTTYDDVWYAWRNQSFEDRVIEVTVTPASGESLAIEAFEKCSSSEPIACKAPSPGSTDEEVRLCWLVPAHAKYRFRVASMLPGIVGDFDLEVDIRSAQSGWGNIGGGTIGSLGFPKLEGSGLLCPGTSLTLDLSNAVPETLSVLWLSVDPTPLPVSGGFLWAYPPLIHSVQTTDTTGAASVELELPASTPIGLELYSQYLAVDPAIPTQVALSNGSIAKVQ